MALVQFWRRIRVLELPLLHHNCSVEEAKRDKRKKTVAEQQLQKQE